jgi:hypothetical protein
MGNTTSYIGLFIFIFSIMVIGRFVFKFFKSFLSTPPQPLELSIQETTINGLFLSYIITYLFYI